MYHDTPEANNEVQDASVPASRQLIGLYFEQLRGEVINVLNRDASYEGVISKLETELAVYKRAYAGLDAEKLQLQRLKQDLEKERNDLENQLKGHRIVTLIDGDGAIFSSHLVEQGQVGGHTAASRLSDHIMQHLQATLGVNHYQLWVYVFLNKRGLMDTFGRVGLMPAKQKFDEFITGFNQAAERFIIVDVGNAKEAADAKIKALLESEIRMPQTEKIIFGGCHDNGYVTALRSQITAGLKNKLILLRSYTEIAVGIRELDLPIFSIPDLFITQKLICVPPSTVLTTATVPEPTQNTEIAIIPRAPDRKDGIHEQATDVLPFALDDLEKHSPRLPAATTYSSIARASPRRSTLTPELDSSGSTTSSDGDEILANPRTSPALLKSSTRRINPNIPLSKHKPPPCTLFYLANCKHGSDCKYGHNYLLQAEHFAEIRMNAKKSPCPAVNKGEICLWGEDCCYGHKCPQTTKCHFLKQGRCKFSGADMHKEPKEGLGMA